jgi:hypothetical protein
MKCLVLPMIITLMFIEALIAGPSVAQLSPSLAGCPIFPQGNIWNTPVEHLPTDSRSSAYIANIGSTTGLHPDFGSGTWNGGPIGIPYNIVPGAQQKVDITFDYADESDPGPYPIPPNPEIEGGPNSTGDRHVLVLDQENCILYELYSAYPQPDGSWQAGSGAIFDFRSNALRPAGWTSADAAGLPILPGLVRYEEVASGEIQHALRFTAPGTRKAYIWPGRHYASSITSLDYPPMGQRFRLKADFDLAGFSSEVQVILQALKKYGMILADNGSAWYISGAPDPRWNNDILVSELRQVPGSAFEAVDESGLMVNPDSGQAIADTPGPTPPTTPSNPGGGGGSGGGCFIATAAYGSPLAPQVRLMREFRDRYLLAHRPGQAVVWLYSKLSPPLAGIIMQAEILRGIARLLLAPLIAWANLTLRSPVPGFGLLLAYIVLFAGGLRWVIGRYRAASRPQLGQTVEARFNGSWRRKSRIINPKNLTQGQSPKCPYNPARL